MKAYAKHWIYRCAAHLRRRDWISRPTILGLCAWLDAH